VRGLVHEILEHYGYRVIEASNGDSALAMWPSIRDQVDLLLTDMVMPGEHNGLDLARKLLADRPDLPVIYTSGYSRELFSGRIGLQEGRNYLPKPYLTAKLLAIIKQGLENRMAKGA
jgi:two-component system, cell cycle sensor histidine kinase and response regulator CckA